MALLKTILTILTTLAIAGTVTFLRLRATMATLDSKYESSAWENVAALDEFSSMSDSQIAELVLDANVVIEERIERDPARLSKALQNIKFLRNAASAETLANVLHGDALTAIQAFLDAEESAANWALANPSLTDEPSPKESACVDRVLKTLEALEKEGEKLNL